MPRQSRERDHYRVNAIRAPISLKPEGLADLNLPTKACRPGGSVWPPLSRPSRPRNADRGRRFRRPRRRRPINSDPLGARSGERPAQPLRRVRTSVGGDPAPCRLGVSFEQAAQRVAELALLRAQRSPWRPNIPNSCKPQPPSRGHRGLFLGKCKTAKSARMDGGARRNRTDDLFNAIEALSQLSYGPTFS